jgi:hypothetical protein
VCLTVSKSLARRERDDCHHYRTTLHVKYRNCIFSLLEQIKVTSFPSDMADANSSSNKKRRLQESSDCGGRKVRKVGFVTGEESEKVELQWEIRNFLPAIEAIISTRDDPDSKREEGLGIQFEMGKTVS